MIKPVVLMFGLAYAFAANAQVDSIPTNNKTSAGKNIDVPNKNVTKRDTNTFTIINVIQPAKNITKNNKQLVKTTDEKSNDDVKTTIVKAKRNSQHWFDAMYVNLICAGINKFVKKD